VPKMVGRARRRIAVVLAVLSGAVGLCPSTLHAQEPKTGLEPMGIVVSGGVSEGAYQAGVMYALMKYLRLHQKWHQDDPGSDYPSRLAGNHRAARPAPGLGSDLAPNFLVAAGASAGNLNSFLAALTWCAANPEDIKPRENLFWDTWINLGWDKLSPVDPRGAAYKKLFLDPLSTGEFRTMDPKDYGAKWVDDKSVYSTADGLVTRSAFAAIDWNAQRRLQAGAYRECLVRIGLTTTRAPAGKLMLSEEMGVTADRFVVPLTVEVHPNVAGSTAAISAPSTLPPAKLSDGPLMAPVQIKNLDIDLATVGLSLALPIDPGTGLVPASNTITLVEASSAFPIAFGPVVMPHCRKGSPDTVPDASVLCPPKWEGTKAAFIDGGIFDNQPFGLGFRLGTYQDNPDSKPRVPTLLYVDTSPVRHAVVGLSGPPAKNGIDLVTSLLGQRISEARGYENLAAATDRAVRLRANRPGDNDALQPAMDATHQQERFQELSDALSDHPPQLSSRFFPIVGNRLVDSFAAFMHPSFRVHDYFVGVYDGIFTVAQTLELNAKELRKPVSERSMPTRETFDKVAEALVGPEDVNLRQFVEVLFTYERQWTGAAGINGDEVPKRRGEVPKQCDLKLLSSTEPRDTNREDAHVAEVFNALCLVDQHSRDLAAKGDMTTLNQYLKDTSDVGAVIKGLTEPLLGDPAAWAFDTEDRLVRRAIDVEHVSRRVHPHDLNLEVEALGARYLAAAAFERDHEIIDLDPSSVARIAGGQWGVGRVFWHLFPYYLDWDPVQGRVSVGWEPKLRFFPWTESFYATAGVDLGLYGHRSSRPIDDGSETKFEMRLTPGGLGWDPGNRWVDDVQLTATMTSPLADVTEWRWAGAELAIHPLGSKFRIAFGFPQLFWTRGGSPEFSDRFNSWYLGFALSDLNGSLYWALRSAAEMVGTGDSDATCEEYCDGIQQ
jgi:hypothetical protein